MSAFTGAGSALGLGVEVVYGTPVARTNWLQLVSISSATKNLEMVENPILSDQATKEQAISVYDSWEGSFTLVPSFTGQGLLWEHAMGSVATVGASAPYTHTFDLAKVLPTGLTSEVKRGNSSNAYTAEGTKINRLRFACAAGQYATLSIDMLGKNEAKAAVGTPAYATTRIPILAPMVGSFAWGARTACLLSMEITIDNQIEQPRAMSCEIEPVRAYAKVTGRVTVEYDSDDAYDDFTSEASNDVTFGFTSAPESISFTGHNMKFSKVGRPVPDGGRITQTLEFECYASAGKSGLEVAIVNAQANHDDN